MTGRRVYPHEDGDIWPMQPGDFGFDPRDGSWKGRPPGTTMLANFARHDVTVHEDGTITVSPSILVSRGRQGAPGYREWHGYLERGVWRTC